MQPMSVVRDFATRLATFDGFPVQSLPSFQEEVIKPKVGPPVQSRPTARRKRVEVYEEDVEMADGENDDPGDEHSVPGQKGKQKDTVPLVPTNTSIKRNLPISPTKTVVQMKRSRMRQSTKEDTMVAPDNRELSHLEFDEDMVILFEDVPAAEGKVRLIGPR